MLYVCFTEALPRLETVGGWRRTCVRRKRRWPSFIIWRWAGPALDGWIRCRWRMFLLHRLPPHPHSTIIASRRPDPGRPVHEKRPPRRRLPGSRPRNPARERPRRPPGSPPPRRPPENQPANRLRKVPEEPPSGGNRRGRVRRGRHPGSGQRRAAGGVRPLISCGPRVGRGPRHS
jgi:hypothetical protein